MVEKAQRLDGTKTARTVTPGEGRHLDCIRATPRHGGFGGRDLYRLRHRVVAQAGAQALRVGDVSPVAQPSEARGHCRVTHSAGWCLLAGSLFVRLRASYCVWGQSKMALKAEMARKIK